MKNRITIKSAKARGRSLQQWAALEISKAINIPCGKDKDIESREMSQAGVDIKLYGEAKKRFPYSVECKNQEKWSVPNWIEQAKSNQQKGTDWLLIAKKNHQKPVIIMDAEKWFKIIKAFLK